jgi:uncharacterized membrane protein YdbT with pleckstrin-like domain
VNDQARPETVVARLRPHGRVLAGPVVLVVAVAGLVPFLAPQFREPWELALVYGLAAILLIMGVILPVVAWLSTSYTITTRRVIVRRGLFVRTRKELLHGRGTEVDLRASGLQPIFGSGDIVLDAGVGQPIALEDVPRSALVQSALVELMADSRYPVADWRRPRDTGELP